MPTLLEILNDPNYVNANPATKEAIFNKYAGQDENYAGANEATQAAIRQRFGIGQPQPPAAEETAKPTTTKAAQPTSERGVGTVASDYGKIISAELARLGSVPEAAVESTLGLAGDIYAPKPSDAPREVLTPESYMYDPEAYLLTGRATEEAEQARYYERRRTADEAIKFVKDTLVPDFIYDLSKGASEKSKAIRESISPELQQKIKDSEIKGNLLEAIQNRDFSDLSFGENPNLEGYFAQGVQVLGSLIPVITTAVVTKSPMATGAVGGTMAASEAVGSAKDYIEKKTDAELIQASPYYAQMRAEGISEKDAREAITANAAGTAAYLQGLVATFGGAFTGKLITGGFRPLSQISKNRLARIAAGTGVGALEEGTQEFLEGIAADYGIDRSVIKEIGEDSFANLILGSLGGGPIGAISGARTKPELSPEDKQKIDALNKLREDAKRQADEAAKAAQTAQATGDPQQAQAAAAQQEQAEVDLSAINAELSGMGVEDSLADQAAAKQGPRQATSEEFDSIVGQLSAKFGRQPTTSELEAAIDEFERDPGTTIESVVGRIEPSIPVPTGGAETAAGTVPPVDAGLGGDRDLFSGAAERTREVNAALTIPTAAQPLAPADIPTYSKEKHMSPLDDATDEYNDAITKYDRYVDRGEAVPEDVQKNADAAKEKVQSVFLSQPEVVSYNGRYYINPARFQWKLNEDGTADDDSARQQFGAYVQANLDAGNKVSTEEEVYEEDAEEPTYKRVEITQLSPDGRSYLNPNYDPNKPTTRFENREYIPFPTSYAGPEGRGNNFEIEGTPVTLGTKAPATQPTEPIEGPTMARMQAEIDALQEAGAAPVPTFTPEPTPKRKKSKPKLLDVNSSQPKPVEQIKEERQVEARRKVVQIRAKIRSIVKKFSEGRTTPVDQAFTKRLLDELGEAKFDLLLTKEKKDSAEDFVKKAGDDLAAGRISQDVYNFITGLYAKLPELLDGLRLRSGRYSAEAFAEAELSGRPLTAGSFDPLTRIIKLYQNTSGSEDAKTIRHELMHSLEQMMTPEAAADLVKSWENAFKAKMNSTKGNPKAQAFFKKAMEYLANPTRDRFEAAIKEMPSYDFYQYMNPSEYWAVNAEPLMLSNLGSGWQKFKAAVRALYESLKDMLGFDNRSAVHRVFKDVMRGSKERITEDTLNDYIEGYEPGPMLMVAPRKTPSGLRVSPNAKSSTPTLAAIKGRFVLNKLKDLRGTARRGLYKIYTPRWLSETAGGLLPQFRATINISDMMSGMTQDIINEGEVGVKKIMDALRRKNGTADVELLGEICNEATIRGIDPDKTTTDVFLNNAWNALSNESKQAYRFMRDFYSKQIDALINDYKETASSYTTDPVKKQQIKDQIENEFKAARAVKPYFPLRRFGQFWFQVGDAKDPNKEFYAFESQSERDFWYEERKKELQAAGQGNMFTDFGNEFLKDAIFQQAPEFDILRRIEKVVTDVTNNQNIVADKKIIAQEMTDSLHQLAYLMIPSNNFRKMFINRKGIQGANADILRVFSSSVMNIANQRAKVKYAGLFRENLAIAVKQHSNLAPTKTKELLGELLKELQDRTPYILGEEQQSPLKYISNGLTQLAFIWYLTAPATAILNNLGMISVGIPTAGKRYGLKRITAKVGKYSARVIRTTYRQVVTKDAKGEIQIKMQAPTISVDLDPNEKLKRLRETYVRQGDPTTGVALTKDQIDGLLVNEYVNDLMNQGVSQQELDRLVSEYESALYGYKELNKVFQASQTHDMAMLAKHPLKSYTNGWQRVVKALAAAFHNSEKFNREVLGMATYEAALEDALKRGMPLDKAREFAVNEAKDVCAEGLGEFNRASNAPAFSNPGFQLLMQFKKYSLLMTYNMYKDVKTMLNLDNSRDIDAYREQLIADGVQGQDLANRVAAFTQETNKFKREAFRRFWGTQVVTTLIGGAKANVFWWPLTTMIELASMGLAAATGDDDDEIKDAEVWMRGYIDEWFGETTSQLLIRGPIAAVANVAITERVSLNIPDLWTRESANKKTAEATLTDTVAENLGPSFAMLKSWFRAYDLMEQGYPGRAIEAAVPAVARNGAMVYRYMDEGVRTKTGETIKAKEDLTYGDLIARALGFAPDDVMRAQKALIARKGVQQEIELKKEKLMGKLYQAFIHNDLDGVQEAIADIQEFSIEYPEAAVDSAQIRQSLESREKRRIENEIFGGVKPKYQLRADEVAKMPGK